MEPSAPVDVLSEQLRGSGLDFGADVPVMRETFEGLLASAPVDPDLVFVPGRLGGVPVLEAPVPGSTAVVIYLHGGAYCAGSAQGYRGVFGQLGRFAGARAVGVDYRLAPEHPYPAALEDARAVFEALLSEGVAAEDIAVVGDSAGGGLAIATLMALRDAGLPLPGCAVVFSPWVDLAHEGESLRTRAGQDPSLSEQGLRRRAADYLQGRDPRTVPLGSPIHGDLSGLPPLLIQVGTAEILLDDATRLAVRAGQAEVHTELQIWPRMVHVFQSFGFILPEGQNALRQAGQFITRHTTH